MLLANAHALIAATASSLRPRRFEGARSSMSRALFRSAPALGAASLFPTTPCMRISWTCSRLSTAAAIGPLPAHREPHAKNARNPTQDLTRPFALKKSHPDPPPSPIADSVHTLLPALAAQPGGHYITVHIHGFPYLVQEGDLVRLPFRIPDAMPGDVLRLNTASVIGSRDYTFKGAPYINPRYFECRATVLGVESEPMRIKIKKKQRCRRKKQAKSKLRFTILRISEFNIKTPGMSTENLKGAQQFQARKNYAITCRRDHSLSHQA
ncbi:hypothetical protein CDD82_2818 [Ophiocordyceps australis]|uniref:Large ribosomal subunit protein bL21m n=1 Tax=Ophiocordyceps australis TaxID=1399860 RepID=A0A2C5XT43_9HYPO|nr:hypothetical protein CDD82_2818 [Ophiocordyceps australis]